MFNFVSPSTQWRGDNRYVQRLGLRLLPKLYAYAKPMPRQAARDMEVELVIALREQGYTVWQA